MNNQQYKYKRIRYGYNIPDFLYDKFIEEQSWGGWYVEEEGENQFHKYIIYKKKISEKLTTDRLSIKDLKSKKNI